MLVRSDLTISQQIVQAAHAAHEAGIRHGNPVDVSSLVLIAVPDEAALRTEFSRIQAAGITAYLFTEPDMQDAATALCTAPITGDARRLFRRYSLWRPKEVS